MGGPRDTDDGWPLVLPAVLLLAGCVSALPPLQDAGSPPEQAPPADLPSADEAALPIDLLADREDEAACVPDTAPAALLSLKPPPACTLVVGADATASQPGSCGDELTKYDWRLFAGDVTGPLLVELGGAAGEEVTGQPLAAGSYDQLELSLVDPQLFDGSLVARFDVAASGDGVQIFQYDLPLENGIDYELSFSARSDSGNDVMARVIQHGTPFDNYGLAETADLQTTWRRFTYTFTATLPDEKVTDGRLQFFFNPYAQAGDVYWLDHVVLRRKDSTDNLLSDPSFEGDKTAWGKYPLDTTTLKLVPLVDSLPQSYAVQLTVTDDAGGVSEPATETFDLPPCP